MKICPKCNSSYSDETLNFCLTDGVPLVVEEAASERLSSQHSWQDAETLHDNNFSLPFSPPGSAHTTSPNSSSHTFSSARLETTSLSEIAPKKSSNLTLLAVVGTLLALTAAVGGFWYFGGNRDQTAATNAQTTAPSGTIEIKKAAVALTAPQETQVKKEVGEMLENWRASIEKRDIEAHMKNYVEMLDNYYRESGIDRNHVRADRQRAFDRYPSINMQVDNLKITPLSTDAASVVFDKSWTFKNPQKISTGSVQQELELVKQNNQWRINGEKDLKVYYINNRENNSNGNPAAPPATNTSTNQ